MKLRSKRRGHALLALFCSLVFLFSAFPVYAEDQKSLESKTSDLQEQLAGINQDLLSISDKISTAEMQVEITNGEIQRTKDSLAEAKANEARQYDDMKTRIKYMYETGNATLLEMLFSAENMTDFLNKADFIQNISNYDRDMLVQLQKTRKEINDKKETLEDQQTSLVKIQKDLEKQQDELEQKAKETSTDLETYQAQLAQLRAEEAAKAKAKAEAEAKAKAEAEANANISGGNHSGGGSNSGNTDGGNSGGGSGGGYDDTVVNGGASNIGGSDLDVFAAILDCEAMHDYNSMLAVATVIMNRVNSPIFPNSITDVVYASGQFEPVWSGRLDSVLSSGPSSLAYNVAQDAINGARLAAVQDCYYFLYAGATDRPGVNIGNNLFFQSW
ncbi:cell wall hydrolase [Faecalicatena sp. AGMB00832]|uniref:Cell wall hydrolase n=1 Tax=Faecalicatena faecalis TaxID=2726362 RepID=A0ABS6CZM1_9FIRM|nr:cell wall hydrolase [Faecalicatena faecalis]MBU3874437.1 cell wall hydrolase [Faecalicatena faecalis]